MIGYYQQIRASMEGRQKPSKVPASLFCQAENFGINELSFDLLIDETNGVEYDVSEHVIENGDAVADHVRRHLRKVTITGLFTNYGLKNNAARLDENGEYKKGMDQIKLNGQAMTQNTALDNYNELRRIADKRQPVRLVAALEIYENMIITNLSTTRGPDDGEAVRFTCELQEIKTISLVTAQYDSGTWTPSNDAQVQAAKARAMAKYKMGGNVTGQDAQAESMAKDLASANQGSWANT